MARFVGACPSCDGPMEVRRLECPSCGLGVDGRFDAGPLARLSREHLAFVEVFLRNRGKIKDVEVALDISYPTVVARLNDVVRSLGFESGDDGGAEMRRAALADEKQRDVLQRLGRGEIGRRT